MASYPRKLPRYARIERLWAALLEMEEATRLGKRILPVNCRPLESVSPPPQLRERNYIFFYVDP